VLGDVRGLQAIRAPNVARSYRVNEVEATFDLAGRTIAIASIERSAVGYNSSLGAGPYKASH
jgi:hypothetical protein